jgi:hypothetical protein
MQVARGGVSLALAVLLSMAGVQSQEVSSSRWPELIRQAESDLSAERIPESANARRLAEVNLRALDSFLATSPTHGSRWREILKLDSALESIGREVPDVELLNDIEKRFRQNYSGLELGLFVQARDALAKYVRAQRFAADPERSMLILRNRLQRLLTQSETPEGLMNANAMHELAQTTAYLQQSNQASYLVSAIRGANSHSNARLVLGSDFIEKGFSRWVNEQNPIDEVILGTTVRGRGTLTGRVSPRLIDSPSNAILQLQLLGDFQGVSRGYNRSVVLNTTSRANISAAESIALTDSGLVSLGDTSADADLRTRINSIEHRMRIVRKIAAKEAAKRKPQADRVSLSRLENRITRQFHEQIDTQLSEANQRLRDAASKELTRLGIERPHRSSWSTRDCMALVWNVQSDAQLAAPGPCPLPASAQGVTLQFHQSIVGNLLDPVLAGRVIRSEDMDGYISQFGEAAKRIPRKEEDGQWSITMQRFQPVELILDDSLVRFRVRTSRLDRDEQSLDQATIDAAYRVEVLDGRIQLHREGDIDITFSESQQKGVRAVALRTFLKNKFEQLFRPQLLDEPIDWSGQLPDQFHDLRLAELSIDDGWMQAHLR